MESIEEMSHKKGMAYTSHIDKQFRLAEKRINQKIEYWYARIAKNNEVSLSAAKEMLRADELEDFHLTVEEYIEKGKTLDFDNRWMQQLENASAKVHIRRLEALQLQMQQECEVLFGNMTDGLDKTLTDVYTSAYYNTAYEFMKGHGVGWAFNKLDTRKIEQAINTAWAYDKKTFKARCWTNKEKLVNELNTTLTQSIIRGESPQKSIDQLSKRMKVSRFNAGRLIMTESCAISTMAQKGCYKELGVEKFEFVATLDSSTSDVCRSMDGQIFNMSDYKIGVNVPPLHCFCRSCTVPYYEDDFGSIGERAAKGDDGETYYVPSNMKYNEWYNKFVENNDIIDNQTLTYSSNDDIIAGAVSGARNPYGEKAKEHAKRYYGLVRTMKTDVEKIASTTGYKIEQIQDIKNYIFMEKHDLGGTELEYFTPDYMMGESWRRLIEGKPEPHDFTLLKHEMMEKNLIESGLSQQEAHNITCKHYNYDKEATEFYDKIKKYRKE